MTEAEKIDNARALLQCAAELLSSAGMDGMAHQALSLAINAAEAARTLPLAAGIEHGDQPGLPAFYAGPRQRA